MAKVAGPWLARGDGTGPALDDAGPVLRSWRSTNGQSQAAVAALLNTTQQHLSQIGTGTRPLSLEQRRRIVEVLGIPAEELGLSAGQARSVVYSDHLTPEIAASRVQWRAVRR